ncbi:MAG: hypothetical protein N3B18_04280 [Desulfobacterota bacterium]|nr:hypothetical protein [Thermodesulfobacteriota bacterium]
MNFFSVAKKITAAASIIIGVCFGFLLSATTHEHHVQYWLLGFIIGFPIVWILYLAVWFIVKGISRTPFPEQARFMVNGLKKLFNTTFTEYQESMLIDMAGTTLLIAAALGIAGAVFVIITGILFILGRLSW